MKKHFTLLLASIFTLLFAACSQENELDATPQERSNLVSISTQLPADFARTRVLPSATDHQLRCILEVWSKGDAASLILRKEQIGAADGENITFNFTLENQGEYDCLMWADFIDASAIEDKGRYADKYYTTTDLKAIEVKDPAKLFNNDACDAFFGTAVLTKTEAAGTVGATLTRPFAKLTLKESDATMYATCQSLEVSYQMPTKFNIATGATSDSQTVTYTAAPKGENVYFTGYLLAELNGALGNINLSFTAKDSQELIEKVIPQGVPAKRNYRTNATGFLMGKKPAASTDATVKVEIEDKWLSPDENENVEAGDKPADPNALAVGDFYYSDGSYSHIYDGAKDCIGIVFAVGAKGGDAIANYNGKITGKIKGYVLAAKDFDYDAGHVAKATKYTGSSSIIPGTVPAIFKTENSYNTTDFLGYKYTQELNTWNSTLATDSKMQCPTRLTEFDGKNATPEGTSGWYIPSAGQLAAIISNYYDSTAGQDLIIKTNLATLETTFEGGVNTLDKAKGRLLTLPPSSKTFSYLSSSIYQKDESTNAKIYGADFRTGENKIVPEKTASASSYMRAVLTF